MTVSADDRHRARAMLRLIYAIHRPNSSHADVVDWLNRTERRLVP